jgi:hypothetical protein
MNPAVTVGVLAAGAMRPGEAAGYIVSQLVGAVILCRRQSPKALTRARFLLEMSWRSRPVRRRRAGGKPVPWMPFQTYLRVIRLKRGVFLHVAL